MVVSVFKVLYGAISIEVVCTTKAGKILLKITERKRVIMMQASYFQ